MKKMKQHLRITETNDFDTVSILLFFSSKLEMLYPWTYTFW